METQACPKCNEPMDEGNLSASGPTGYVSKKQTGMLRTPTKLSRVYACPNCGYVEIYLNPQELKSRIS